MKGIEMGANEGNEIDVAVGRLLGVAALVLGAIGLFAGLTDKRHATQWDLASLLLALSAGSVAFNELAKGGPVLQAWLSTLLRAAALGAGGVGLVLGLGNSGRDFPWQVAGIVLAILGLAAKTDALRLLAATRRADGFAELGIGFGLLAVLQAAIGFILGLNDSSHSATWLYSAVICAVIALSCSIAAEHRALLQRKEGEMSR
jgi:cell shape-determining protein MreD